MQEDHNKSLDKIAKPKMQEKEATMSDVSMAANYIRDAFPPDKYGNAKAACWAAYRKLKLSTERRARAIWNGEAKRIDAHEMEALKHAAYEQYKRDREDAQRKIERFEMAVLQAAQGNNSMAAS